MIQPLFVFSDWSILILRVALGVILFAHGMQKVHDWKGALKGFGGMGFKPAKFWLSIVTALEIVGGLFLIVGLFTQIVAFLIAIQFLVIIVKVKRKQGLIGGIEFDLLIFAAALLFLAIGGGSYSADALIGILLY